MDAGKTCRLVELCIFGESTGVTPKSSRTVMRGGTAIRLRALRRDKMAQRPPGERRGLRAKKKDFSTANGCEGTRIGRGREECSGAQRSEVRGRRSEVGGRRSEVGGRRSEVRGQRSEVGDRKSEVGDRKSEVGGQRSERRDTRESVERGVARRELKRCAWEVRRALQAL
jgi:hypothetical protein